ncbi:hypothetical protein L6V77_24495 [Myxococcota bacterium]|nr:hypothetical protein [Myxococcota bacterium]
MPSSRPLAVTALFVSLATAGGVAWLVRAQLEARAATAAVLARAEQLVGAGEAACAAFETVPCADACARAAAIGSLLHDGLALAERADRCRDRAVALEIVGEITPPEGVPGRGRATAARLAAGPALEDRALGAALDAALFRGTGAFLAARSRLEKAVADGLTSPWLDWQLARLALAEARLADAEAALGKVVAALPAFGPGWHQMGVVSLAGGRRDAAIAALRKAAGLSDDPQVALDLARAFLAGEMWAEAIEPLETVLRGRPAEVDAVRLLALAQHNLRRYAAAAELYRKAFSLDRQPRTLLSAVISLHAGGRLADAFELTTALLPDVDRVPETRFVRAGLLADLGRPAESRAEYERYVEFAGARPEEAERVRIARERLAAVR